MKKRRQDAKRQNETRHQRARYGRDWEDRMDAELEKRNLEKALELRHLAAALDLQVADLCQVAMRFLDLVRAELAGDSGRWRLKGVGADPLVALEKRLEGRPEASRACRCHVTEPEGGDGWAEE